ncbi:caprin-2 isoform X2 [Bombina bombina]|uniref:caprin-2 isoform X2 n=1 Tax=Bombina bombina TaxID=8345 RepID=UPI00235A4CC9|nr:caprin-2 isoform X2 [Bombina bombina]
MVQLSPCNSEDGGGQLDKHLAGCQLSLSPLQASVASSVTQLQAYETYLDNGFVSLKHKIRNIEKKKVKLEDYKDRLRNGEQLNPDQQEAVEKYDEVIHNLEFAKDLQKTFIALSQDLLKVQKKGLRKEHLLKVESDKRRLRTILQVQYMLQSFGQEHVQKDFKEGLNGAMYISSKELDYLVRFSKLACPKRYKHMSLEDQMEQSCLYFWNFLEGSDKTVAGTTYKYLKELAARLLDCGYFENVPDPPCEKPKTKTSLHDLLKSNANEKLKLDIKEPEPSVDYVKPIVHPQELPIRQYLTKPEAKKPTEVPKPLETNYTKSEVLKPWSVTTEVPKPLETNYTKSEVLKPWSVTTDLELQDQKRWPSSPVMVMPKLWHAAQTPPPTQSIQPVPNPQTVPNPQIAKSIHPVPNPLTAKSIQPAKKLQAAQPEPKERRERMTKHPVEIKSMNTKDLKVPIVINKHPVKKQEVLSSGENRPLRTVPSTPPNHRILPQSAAEFSSSPTLPKDPELRKQMLKDLIDQIKGTCNFMQDSMLDFELSPRVSSPLPPESPLAAPIELNIQNMDPPQTPEKESSLLLELEEHHILTCNSLSEPESTESLSLGPQATNPVITVAEDTYNTEPLYVTTNSISESLPERKQASLSLTIEPPPSPKTPPMKTSVLQLKQEMPSMSPPPRSVPMPMTSSPFQGIQTVFKVNAPLPPRKEIEIKDDPPYSPVCHQTFSTASTQTLPHPPMEYVDHSSLLPEPLTSSLYHSDASTQLSNGSLCYTSAPSLVPRLAQPYPGGRGPIRGTSRGGRIMTNTYRFPNGFKGPETYRGPQPVSNGTYGHIQCTGREYPTMQFTTREGNSHLSHKRGSVSTTTRPSSRGWSESSQVSSPERPENTSVADSGHGDSRSISSMDMSLTSQATTILPVHVYPLPQQMRVAFSAARTSNFAPGTLDQPIVFDLLLNNLGDTFDFQVGRFVCPVNGTYVFIFHMLKLAVNVPLYVNLMRNEEVLVSAYANDGAPDHETASNHAVLQLFQGDQIWLRLHRGAIYGSSWKYSTFSGYLLYQD